MKRPCTWMSVLSLSLVVALGACGGSAADSGPAATDAGDGGPDCGSTQGFVFGTVTGAEEPSVVARSSDGVEVPADAIAPLEEGGVSYELNLDPGSWVITAEAEGCVPNSGAVEVEACIEFGVNLELACDG